MCTIGYHRKLNIIFKNRDKITPVCEVLSIRPEFLAVKSEDASYYSLGANRHGVGFVSAAVNTPGWTSLIYAGKHEEAAKQFKKENGALVNPMTLLSHHLPGVRTVDELLEILLNDGGDFMGYNIVLADIEKAAHVELYQRKSHVSWLGDVATITNHFQHISHGPKESEDYPSSFKRLDFASKEIQNAVSIEDFFQVLKTQHGETDGGLWRQGVFSTISSSVIDLEAHALYYSADHDHGYKRVASDIPPKGTEKIFIEMSRYIDLPTYHKIERGHPFYVEMIEEIKSQIERYLSAPDGCSGKGVSTLELGAGTGLCSLELIKFPFLQLDVLEIDKECCKILSNHPEAARYNVVLGDAVTHCKRRYYDLVVSTFAHDHIHYNKRFTFARNIRNNLKKGGFYVMGGELLPYFSNDTERKKSLFLYHNYIIDLALKHNRVQVAELENNALKSGLGMVGDFKRHEGMFEEEMLSANFELLGKIKIGPKDFDNVGGVFVYIYKAI